MDNDLVGWMMSAALVAQEVGAKIVLAPTGLLVLGPQGQRTVIDWLQIEAAKINIIETVVRGNA